MRKLKVLFLCAAAVFIFAGCASQTAVPKKIETNEVQKPVEKPKPQTFNIGDTVELRDSKITFNSMRTMKGDSPNKIYLVLNLTVENISESEKNLSSVMNMSLIDEESYKIDSTIFLSGELKGKLDGSIPVGGKLRGEVGFEIPKDKKKFDFVYKDDYFSEGQAVFKIMRE